MFEKRWVADPANIIRGNDPQSVIDETEAALLRARNIDAADVNAFFAPSVLPPVPEDPSLESAADPTE